MFEHIFNDLWFETSEQLDKFISTYVFFCEHQYRKGHDIDAYMLGKCTFEYQRLTGHWPQFFFYVDSLRHEFGRFKNGWNEKKSFWWNEDDTKIPKGLGFHNTSAGVDQALKQYGPSWFNSTLKTERQFYLLTSNNTYDSVPGWVKRNENIGKIFIA